MTDVMRFIILFSVALVAVGLPINDIEYSVKTAAAPTPACCTTVSKMTTANVRQPIGAPGAAKVCMIVAGSASTACQYYVRYSTDGGKTFLGLTYEGTPGGTGCPAGNSDFASAVKWLQTKYIAQGYCCAEGATSSPRKSGVGPLPVRPDPLISPIPVITHAPTAIYLPFPPPTSPTGGGYGTPTSPTAKPPTSTGYGTPVTAYGRS